MFAICLVVPLKFTYSTLKWVVLMIHDPIIHDLAMHNLCSSVRHLNITGKHIEKSPLTKKQVELSLITTINHFGMYYFITTQNSMTVPLF